MSTMPQDAPIDSSAALLADPYRYITDRCRALGSDLFEGRMMLVSTVFMTGPEAARLFYDPALFQREGAAPEPLRATLLGKDTLQNLDGPAHRLRKQLFLDVADARGMQDLVRQVELGWWSLLERLAASPRPIVLYEAACEVLTRAVCTWAGVPLPEEEVEERMGQLRALFEETANSLSGHLRSRLARGRAEEWLEELIEQQRQGEAVLARGRAAERFALDMRRPDGTPLPAGEAAQELLNLLRPTVAVSVYIVFAAHALHAHPHYRDWLEHDDARARAFVDEVRRWYPFFPAIAARTRTDFRWKGYYFPQGQRVLLDLYGTNHDERGWNEPWAFRPQRFLERTPGAFDFVPQGGGDATTGHRCPGEGIAVALTRASLALLNSVGYRVPQQDLDLDMTHLPALPRDRFVIELAAGTPSG